MSVLALQLERPGGLLELDGPELDRYAESLGWAWAELGIRAGDRVVVYDYGASPAACLASKSFTPHLKLGAAEITASQVLCVDGLPDNAERVAHVLRYFKPDYLFARADAVPLIVSGPTAVPEADRGATLVVTVDGEYPAEIDRRMWERAWTGGVEILLRWDAAAFIAPLCPDCGSLRVSKDFYSAHVAGDGNDGTDGWGVLSVEPVDRSVGTTRTDIEAHALESAACCGKSNRFRVR